MADWTGDRSETDTEDEQFLRAGDAERLLAKYYAVVHARVTASCRRRGLDHDDVFQQVVERLLNDIRAGRSYPVPFRIAVEKVITWTIGDASRARGRSREDAGEVPERGVPDRAFESIESDASLHLAFSELPAGQRDILTARYLEGLERSELATRFAIPVNAVDQRLHRAHRALRERRLVEREA